jgi:uncharacterized protein (DUF1015 family)
MDRLSDLVAPPYDVISPAERATLAARDPRNIVHVMLPEANGDRYKAAAATLEDWRRSKALLRDDAPSMYVFRQEFVTPAGARYARTGVFGALSAEPYSTRRVRPHEHTHAGPKADRLALIESTHTTIESIFVLSPDTSGELKRLLASASADKPFARGRLSNVEFTVWRVSGTKANEIAAAASAGPLYIADGHHRFETAGAYRTRNHAAERTIALIVPLGDPGLVVLPTHRVIRPGVLDGKKVRAVLERYFEVESLDAEMDAVSVLTNRGRDNTAGLIALPQGRLLSFVWRKAQDGVEEKGIAATLDVARIDRHVVEPLLKLASPEARVDYTPDPAAVFNLVGTGAAAGGVLLNPTKVADVLRVADAGEVMPPKSTYFIPKVPSGVLLLPHPAT